MGEVVHFAFRKSNTPVSTYERAEKKQHLERTEKLKITHPDQVATLPWSGNFGADRHLHQAVTEYVTHEPNSHKAYRAEYHASKLGMGEEIDKEPSAEWHEYHKQLYEDHNK